MWWRAYTTRNESIGSSRNPYTRGQCGGMCAVWIGRMFKRKTKMSITHTWPDFIAGQSIGQIVIDTHLAAFHVPASKYQTKKDSTLDFPSWKDLENRPIPPPRPFLGEERGFRKDERVKRAPKLAPGQADEWKEDSDWPLHPKAMAERVIAAARLKPGLMLEDDSSTVIGWLTAGDKQGAHYIDVGGHSVATFVDHDLAPYESRPRLYYFDPNHGCWYSENENDFSTIFQLLIDEHQGKNPGFAPHRWYMLEVESTEEEIINISRLFA